MESIGYDNTMATRKKSKLKVEFGDFQTPRSLAGQVCSVLSRRGLKPLSILEPNCGKGGFLIATIEYFGSAKDIVGVEINREYVNAANSALGSADHSGKNIRIIHEDFFKVQWRRILKSLPDPLLVIGNPPWVTNAELGILGSSNLPVKSNFQNRRGFDAITGKSNFDISEWMLIQELEWINGRQATLAMLCKTAVARKVLHHAWKNGLHLERSDIYLIDALKHFGAAVDACLLVVMGSLDNGNFDCQVHESLEAESSINIFGYRDKHLVSNVTNFDRWKHLEGEERYKWRSGIKHDCSKVMELREENGQYRNRLGEIVDLEDDYLYPMLKSSDIANGRDIHPSRWMLVTQHHIGENTRQIQLIAPKTWQYLIKYAHFLDQRSSSIYHNRPRFSVFGVGAYSFSQWKVAISGFYKKLDFRVVGPYRNKPVVVDDTCYFIACKSRREAVFLSQLFNSEIARNFFSAFIFWDEKRPITLSVLSHLDILALAHELNLEDTLNEFLRDRLSFGEQLPLFSIKNKQPSSSLRNLR